MHFSLSGHEAHRMIDKLLGFFGERFALSNHISTDRHGLQSHLGTVEVVQTDRAEAVAAAASLLVLDHGGGVVRTSHCEVAGSRSLDATVDVVGTDLREAVGLEGFLDHIGRRRDDDFEAGVATALDQTEFRGLFVDRDAEVLQEFDAAFAGVHVDSPVCGISESLLFTSRHSFDVRCIISKL